MLAPPPGDRNATSAAKEAAPTDARQWENQDRVDAPEPPETKRRRAHWAKVAAAGFSMEVVLAGVALLLTLAGLARVEPTRVASSAVVAVAAGLLVASRFRRFAAKARTRETGMAEVGAISFEYLTGGPAIILGVLALAGIVPLILTTVAMLLFGVMLMFGGTETSRQANISTLYPPPRPPDPQMLRLLEWIAGFQMVTGIAAVILGIMSLVGIHSMALLLFGLLAVSLSKMLGSAAVVWRMRRAS